MQDALGAVQSILVLGGSSEIARAIALRLVESRGRTVVLAARDPESCTAVVAELRERGATNVEVVAFDASDTATHEKVIAGVFAQHDIDLVLLAFGVLGDQDEFEAEPETAVPALTTNYVGAVTSGLEVAKALRAQGHGTLVVLSSVAAERARRSNFVYGSSKAALDAFAQGLGDSLAGTG